MIHVFWWMFAGAAGKSQYVFFFEQQQQQNWRKVKITINSLVSSVLLYFRCFISDLLQCTHLNTLPPYILCRFFRHFFPRISVFDSTRARMCVCVRLSSLYKRKIKKNFHVISFCFCCGISTEIIMFCWLLFLLHFHTAKTWQYPIYCFLFDGWEKKHIFALFIKCVGRNKVNFGVGEFSNETISPFIFIV